MKNKDILQRLDFIPCSVEKTLKQPLDLCVGNTIYKKYNSTFDWMNKVENPNI